MRRAGDSHDAIVVGGGPAGSTFAWKARTAGWRILVLDQAVFPRVKLCAGWITPGVWTALQLDPVDYSRGHICQPFHGFSLSRMKGGASLFDYGRPVSFGIIRSEFDQFLLQRSGAEVVEGHRVRELQRENGLWVVDRKWRAPLLIGAGGHYCPVARLLGVTMRGEKCISTLELEKEVGEEELRRCEVSALHPEIVFFDDIRGYGWCFRKGRFLNVGVGRTRSNRLREHLVAFLAELKRRRILPEGTSLRQEEFRGHAYKLHFVTPRPSFDTGALLLGDAAGLSYNYSGEGIKPAIISALLAWDVVQEARGDYSAGRLAAFREKLFEAFGTPVTGWRFRMMERLPPIWFQTLGRITFGSPLLKRWFLEKLFVRLGS